MTRPGGNGTTEGEAPEAGERTTGHPATAVSARIAPERVPGQPGPGNAPAEGSGGPAGRGASWWRIPLIVTAAVAPLYLVWAVWLATGGGDLAAQFAWTAFAREHPSSAYNLSWYGGMHTVNYSVLTPPLMAFLGVRTVSVAAGLIGTWALALLVVRSPVARPLWPALLGALAVWCNIASGRTTFALGFAIGLVALVYIRRPALAAVGTALATLASPVAGLFLVVVGAAWLLERRWHRALALLVPPALVVAVTTVLFPFSGEMPMPSGKLWLPLLVCATLVVAAPPAWRMVRYGAGIYAVGVVLTFFIPTPIGTNVERLAGLAGPVVLLAAVLTAFAGVPRSAWFARSRAGLARLLLVAVLAVNVSWLGDKTEDDLTVSTVVPAWAEETDGVVRELKRLGSDRMRVEVVPARNHREATVLAPHLNMARGWNRQLDVERGRLFYDGSLSEESYRQWLDRWAVGLVVLPHGRIDGPAEDEAELVRSGPAWLERVWSDEGWSIFRVKDPVPLVPAPATVVRGDASELVVRMPAAGSVTVRVAYSPWLRAEGACLSEDGEYTRLTVERAGEYRLDSRYRFPGTGDGGC
ncbi:glycosyltransferase family 87 protein [Streptomyces sp. NPDC000594]|uniref:glycosyltransferase family 87 protein n=1 Tax=Streptomyces sp. NPDC000594 TaxID=3154261 RepID=UPI00332209D8